MRKVSKSLVLVVMALVLTIILTFPVSAGRLRVTNHIIQSPVTPGSLMTQIMNVRNIGAEPMDVAVEVRGLGNELSGPMKDLPVQEDLSPYTARPFITVSPTRFHLESEESRDVTVTINVPADVGDGGRYAAIYIYTAPSGSGQIGISVAVGAQVILTIENSNIIISGNITAIDIPQVVTEQFLVATTTLHNTGNYHYKVTYNGTINDSLGQVVGTAWQTDSVSSLLPTFSQQVPIALNVSQELTPGNYSVEISAYTQEGAWLDTDSRTFVIEEPYEPPPLNPLAIGFFEEGKLSVYQWSMAEDGTLMEKVEASSLTTSVTIDILQGTIVTGDNGEPPDPITVTALDTLPSPLNGYKTVAAFEFSSEGINFNPYADITLKYLPDDIPAGVSETQLVLKTLNEDTDKWITVEDSEIDTDGNTITFPVTHFSIYAVFAPSSGAASRLWIWAVVGAIAVVLIAFSINTVQHRRAVAVRREKERRRRQPRRPQGPRDNW